MTVKEQEGILQSIGMVIDSSMVDFVDELNKQKVNIGVMKNMVQILEATYNELFRRKNLIMKSIETGYYKKDNPEIVNAFNGIYSEMTKIEEKVVYLKRRINELSDVG